MKPPVESLATEYKGLLAGLPPEIAEPMIGFAAKLIPNIRPGEFGIGGGLAARYHAAKAGSIVPDYTPDAIEITVIDAQSVLPDLAATDVLFAHYHLGGDDEFYMSVVDPQSKLTAHIRTDLARRTFTGGNFGNYMVNVNPPAALFANTVLELQKLGRGGQTVDPQLFTQAELLLPCVSGYVHVARTAWQQLHPQAENLPDIFQAYQSALNARSLYPDLLRPNHKDEPYDCTQCMDDIYFPVSDMAEIKSILGYVE